jgi:transposase
MQKPKPPGFVCRAEADFKYDLPPHGPALGAFQRIIGIDPGRTYTATSYDGERTTQVSNKEIRHKGKVDQFQVWERRLRKREPEYGANLAALPTLKVTDFQELKQNIATTLARSVFLLRFCADKPFRKWRFKRQVFLNKAYCAAARKILDDPNVSIGRRRRRRRRTLVGYGDWSNQDGTLRGTPKSGVKRLKRALRSYGATVVMVDEFKTSKTCSACHRTVEKASYKGVECHQVVRCQNPACRTYWQRDFNAARNILTCFQHKVSNQPRPAAMIRGA